MSIERDIRRILMALSRLTRTHGRKSFEFDEILNYLFPPTADKAKLKMTLQDTLIYLEENNLISDVVKTDQEGICAFKLSPQGEMVYREMQRNKESILSILKNINLVESKKISFNVTESNIAVNSPHVRQNIYISKDISYLIDKISETLKNDNQIASEQFHDALIDLETIQKQLLKKVKNKELILSILNSLGSITSISSFVVQLIGLIK